MKSKALVKIAKESGQANGTILPMNILKMLARLLMTPGAKPLWLINSQCIPQIATLTLEGHPMFVSHGGLTEGLKATLLGYPILFTEHATALGEEGDISLVDMQGYESYRRSSGPEFATSIHLFFDYNMEAFRWMFRYGGQPYLSKPVAGAKAGTDSKSHFVTLAKRAA
jgi:HK97 family phage major capsid protein